MEIEQQATSLPVSADQLTDIIWKISSGGQIFFSNQHSQNFTGGRGLVVEQNQKFPPAEFIHHEDLDKLAEAWDQARLNSTQFTREVRIKRGWDGQYIWHLTRFWPIFDSLQNRETTRKEITDVQPGKPSYWLAVCTDVHGFKTLQNMFQLVMDNIPISIFWKDRNSAYLGCNKLFASDVGRTTTESVVGMNDYDNPSSKEQSDFFVQCDRRVMESDVAEYHIIEPQLRADGKQAWLDTNKIPLHDAGGKVIGVLGMYEDITERMLLEHQREDFVATLTHDLKNPLLGTNRLLNLLVAGKLGELEQNQRDILNQVQDSNSALISMIQNLLDVYRYDSIKKRPDAEEINIGHYLDTAIKQSQLTGDTKQLVLNLELPQQEIIVEISSHAFTRVIHNLLNNAIKFSPVNGVIDVQLRANPSANCCEIEVRDYGPGIAADEQEQLFKRFWQGTPGKKYSHGTGLGLYLCKQIIETHKGNITCSSVPDKGSSFTITLPVSNRATSK